MTDRPILFSGPMVRAILDGSKTQTRRVVTKATATPAFDHGNIVFDGAFAEPDIRPGCGGQQLRVLYNWDGDGIVRTLHSRIQIGDTLWVRETFALSVFDPECPPENAREPDGWDALVHYKADDRDGKWTQDTVDASGKLISTPLETPPWRPSIHMPRWVSRLSLKVTDVRAQRVQHLSHDDIAAEGVDVRDHKLTRARRVLFAKLWDSINAKRGYPWKANPWVFAYTFEVVT